jgi:hypothetical protein
MYSLTIAARNHRSTFNQTIDRRLQCICYTIKLEYEDGLIKEESTSELLRFTISIYQSKVNQPEYLILKQQQKQVQNNQQQQLHNQHSSLQSTIVGHKHQISNTYQRK